MPKRKLDTAASNTSVQPTKHTKHNTTTVNTGKRKRQSTNATNTNQKRKYKGTAQTAGTSNINKTIIHDIYGINNVYTLHMYLTDIRHINDSVFVQHNHNDEYKQFLNTTLVTTTNRDTNLQQHNIEQTAIQYLIHYVINTVLQQHYSNPQQVNILTCGYRKLTSGTYGGVRHFPLIEQKEFNTVHNILLNQYWLQLYKCINNNDIFIELLCNTCVFHCVDDKHNYIQLCGAPVHMLLYEKINAVKIAQPMSLNKHLEKVTLSNNGSNDNTTQYKPYTFNIHKLNTITISRQSILYAHIPYNQLSNGLATNHILNRCSDSLTGAEQLFAYIWPNCVKVKQMKKDVMQTDVPVVQRKSSIPAMSPTKPTGTTPTNTPKSTVQHYYIKKQYKPLLHILKHIIHKHKSLPYSTLINRCYSLDTILPAYNTQSSSSNNSMQHNMSAVHTNDTSNVATDTSTSNDISNDAIMTDDKENRPVSPLISNSQKSYSQPTTEPLQTISSSQQNILNNASQTSSTHAQASSNKTSSNSTSPDKSNHTTNTEQYNKQMQHRIEQLSIEQLVNCHVSTHSVHTFIVNCLVRILPKSLFGSKHNIRVLYKLVQCIIELRRYETYTLHLLIQQFKFNDLHTSIKQIINHANSSIKQHNMMHLFIYWLINDYVLQLLKLNFYVTDIDARKNTVVYYSKPIWSQICTYTVQHNLLYNNQYTQLPKADAHSLLLKEQQGYTALRVRPKRTGIRSIQNMAAVSAIRTETGQLKQFMAVNQSLRPLFEALKYEKQCNSAVIGSTVTGTNDIYTKFKQFVTTLRKSKKHSKLYAVTVDLKSCYDSINRDKLFACINMILQCEQYGIQRYVQSYATAPQQYRVKNSKYVFDTSEIPMFEQYVKTITQQSTQSIYSDTVIRQYQAQDTLKQLFRSHMYSNIIKFQNKYYLQQNGISQGSIVSTLLCCIYLALLERTSIVPKLKKVCTHKATQCNTLLLRQIDDFMLLTTCKQKAATFLQLMSTGFVQYGVSINTDKTQCNLQCNNMAVPWNGYIIHTKHAYVTLDYTKMITQSFNDLLTVFYSTEKSGYGLQYVYKRYLTQKLSDILIDVTINNQYTIYLNIYELVVFGTYKIIAYYKSLNQYNNKLFYNKQRYLCTVLLTGIQYLYNIVCSKSVTLNQLDIRLLCLCGVLKVLQRYKSHVKTVYDKITYQLTFNKLLKYIDTVIVNTGDMQHKLISKRKHSIQHTIKQVERNSFVLNKLKQLK